MIGEGRFVVGGVVAELTLESLEFLVDVDHVLCQAAFFLEISAANVAFEVSLASVDSLMLFLLTGCCEYFVTEATA
jgi:hypothetical protein